MDSSFETNCYKILEISEKELVMTLSPMVSKIIIPITPPLKINDGNWHHVIFTWISYDGAWNVTVDSIRLDGGANYAEGLRMPQYGAVALGAKFGDRMKAVPKSGFLGRISLVRVWNRALEFRSEIPRLQSCGAALVDGLIHQMVDGDLMNGKVEFSRPSECSRPQIEGRKGRSGPLLVCPTTKHVVAPQGNLTVFFPTAVCYRIVRLCSLKICTEEAYHVFVLI